MKIGNRQIGPGYPPFIIAEIGGNHHGSFSEGKKLIDAAIKAGADAVKLQAYTADTLTFKGEGDEFRIMEGPWAGRTLHDLYSEAQTPNDLLAKLIAYGQKRGVTIFSSVFDLDGVDTLVDLGVEAIKIASFELTDLPLIEKAAATDLPMIISTGMGSTKEITDAMNAFYSNSGRPDQLAVLHCVSEYPAKPSEANLPALGPLSSLLGGRHVVGLSDHSLGVGVSAGAIAFGACMVEKHLCLDRNSGGPDSGFSLQPDEFALLVRTCHEAWQATRPFVQKKRPPNLAFRKSLYAVRDVSRGEQFSKENCRAIRPASGLEPCFYQSVLAGVATRSLKAGTPLKSDMVSTLC